MAATRAAAAPGDPLPVTVTLETLDPRDVRPDSALRVTAVLRNTGPDPTGPLTLRLRRGAVLDTRGELQAADTTPPPTGSAAGAPAQLDAGLAPGQARRVTYQTTVAELGLSRLGVYPVALTVQSAEDGEELGRLQTQLPYFPPGIDTTGTRVALVWPLLDRPHRLTGGGEDRGAAGERPPALFDDDGLADAVRDGGRLDRLLDVAEQVAGSVRLTLLVDPETIEELDRMTAGYRVGASAARSVPGRGAQAAAGWLGRLRQVAPKHLLVAVPYADPDVVALARGGNSKLARVAQPDIDATARVLGVVPTTDVAWPPDGLLTDPALDEVVAQGAGVVVLDPAALPGGPVAGQRPHPERRLAAAGAGRAGGRAGAGPGPAAAADPRRPAPGRPAGRLPGRRAAAAGRAGDDHRGAAERQPDPGAGAAAPVGPAGRVRPRPGHRSRPAAVADLGGRRAGRRRHGAGRPRVAGLPGQRASGWRSRPRRCSSSVRCRHWWRTSAAPWTTRTRTRSSPRTGTRCGAAARPPGAATRRRDSAT